MRRSTGPAALGILLFLAAAPGASAASVATTTRVADAAQVHAAAVIDRDDEAVCNRMRRRLWIEGEGWVVRRITTCR